MAGKENRLSKPRALAGMENMKASTDSLLGMDEALKNLGRVNDLLGPSDS